MVGYLPSTRKVGIDWNHKILTLKDIIVNLTILNKQQTWKDSTYHKQPTSAMEWFHYHQQQLQAMEATQCLAVWGGKNSPSSIFSFHRSSSWFWQWQYLQFLYLSRSMRSLLQLETGRKWTVYDINIMSHWKSSLPVSLRIFSDRTVKKINLEVKSDLLIFFYNFSSFSLMLVMVLCDKG